jgi:hypothetical protein
MNTATQMNTTTVFDDISPEKRKEQTNVSIKTDLQTYNIAQLFKDVITKLKFEKYTDFYQKYLQNWENGKTRETLQAFIADLQQGKIQSEAKKVISVWKKWFLDQKKDNES